MPNYFTVRLGEHDISKPFQTEITNYTVQHSQITVHSSYNPFTFDFDIAIIKLKPRVAAVTPIALPNKGSSFENEIAIAAGWGRTNPGNTTPASDVLRKVELSIWSNIRCHFNYYQYKIVNITENMLCANDYRTKPKSTCNGDSGGPLICRQNNKDVLCGLVSASYFCAKKDFPTIFVRTTEFLSWICENASEYGLECILQNACNPYILEVNLLIMNEKVFDTEIWYFLLWMVFPNRFW